MKYRNIYIEQLFVDGKEVSATYKEWKTRSKADYSATTQLWGDLYLSDTKTYDFEQVICLDNKGYSVLEYRSEDAEHKYKFLRTIKIEETD